MSFFRRIREKERKIADLQELYIHQHHMKEGYCIKKYLKYEFRENAYLSRADLDIREQYDGDYIVFLKDIQVITLLSFAVT